MAGVAGIVRKSFRELHGVVVTAGLMQRTVKVRVGGQKWNGKLKKYFDDPKTHLVHDPNDSLRAGDIVAITPGWRTSKHKRHVVKHIIAPSGTPIEERPPIPTEEERWDARDTWRQAKDERRASRRQSQPSVKTKSDTTLSTIEKTPTKSNIDDD